MSEARKGLLFGFSAYALWGVVPIYWPLLQPAGSVEILAHRVLWSCLMMGLLVVVMNRTSHFRALFTDRRILGLLVLGAVIVTVNWGVYIWGVTSGRVVETSLGYFINPLVTVLMGVLLLGERLRPLQWWALGVAVTAVVVLSIDYGRLPYIALILAFSFATYGLIKKTANVGAVESIALETLVLVPVAASYLTWLVRAGESHFTGYGLTHSVLFISTGAVTAIPLILFGAAAIRVPMVSLGLLQYLAPTLQFLLGIFWFHEEMPAGRWAGFVLVWVALAMFTTETLRHRRQVRLAVEASTAA